MRDCQRMLSDWINGLPVQPRRVKLNAKDWDALIMEIRGVPGCAVEAVGFCARRGLVTVVPMKGGR